MSRYNDGVITTNKNCIACNRCVASCPVVGTNVNGKMEGKNCIEVSGKKCIECGNCIRECSHGARDYRDDTLFFFKDLENGKKISVIIDPTFYMLYGKTAYKLIGYLRTIGVDKIYDVGIGAEISVWAHAKYLKEYKESETKPKAFITHICPAVANYAKKCNPEMLPYIIPVQTPAICTAIYVRKYLEDTNPIAYLGPCIAMTDETSSNETFKSILYNVTIAHLMDYLREIDFDRYYSKPDYKCETEGRLICSNGVFRRMVERYFPSTEVFTNFDHIDEKMIAPFCKQKGINEDWEQHPMLTEISACAMGCLMGGGIDAPGFNYNKVYERFAERSHNVYKQLEDSKDYKERYEELCAKFKSLNFFDFTREFSENYRQPYIVPQKAYEAIFERMHKDTQAKRNINCKFCGYPTCVEMAKAVASGYAKMENCIHYLNDELKSQVYIDMLTGLPNMARFIPEVEHLLSTHKDRSYVLGVCNINKVMVINRLYGRSVGDAVLVNFANYMREFIGDGGLCCRLGGGFFGFCYLNTSERAKKLKETETYDYRHLGVDFPVTVRAGVYKTVPGDEVPVGKILDYCTYAMTKVTDRSHNDFRYFDDAIHTEIILDSEITKQMKQSMADGEFVIYLQPQFNHASNKLVGAEVLSRWVKKDGTIISPAIFVPIFEKNGFVKELDRHVWKSAFILIKKWMDEGIPMVPISVNVSRMSLVDDEIIGIIHRFKDEYNIDTKYLHFEVTESAYMADQDAIIERVNRIRDMGFEIAMDDFGTGYSSLNVLKDMPLDILKLDMGFLRGDTNMDKGTKIIEYIIHMANTIGLKTIAEGVETNEQAEFLEQMGCDVIQGFLYSQPIPAAEYELLIKSL